MHTPLTANTPLIFFVSYFGINGINLIFRPMPDRTYYVSTVFQMYLIAVESLSKLSTFAFMLGGWGVNNLN